MVNMAHVACHRGEPSPHSYHPTSRPSDRDHGAVSEYESLNVPHKLHTKFVADSEIPEDFIPLIRAPAPAWPSCVLETDPTLCVTPDKLGSGNKNHRNNVSSKTTIPSLPKPDPRLCLTPEQPIVTVSRVTHHGVPSVTGVIPAKPTLVEPDPLLAVTPEKPTPVISKTKSSLKTDKYVTDMKHKMRHKVRFDICASHTEDKDISANLDSGQDKSAGSKVYQPKLYTEIDKSHDAFFDSDDQPRSTDAVLDMDCGYGSLIDSSAVPMPSGLERAPSKVSGDSLKLRKKNFSVNVERESSPAEISERPDFVIPNTNKGPPKRKVVVTREFQERPVITEYQYPFDSEDVSSDTEHVFSRPEFHNSLKVYSEMKELDNMVPDIATALQRHLEDSEEKRTEISEKASSKVNKKFCSSQYSGLVGLEAPIGDLCRKTEKQMTLKARSAKPATLRKPGAEREPDLMEFFHSNLEKEAPDFHLTGVTPPSEDLATAPQSLAFDLYRHNRVWEGIHWK